MPQRRGHRDSAPTPRCGERWMYERWREVAVAGRVLRCVDGTELTVVSSGRRNNGPGPDFLDAVLLRNGEIIIGAVEMHLRAEEWFAHGHDGDRAYNGVVLHVVAERPLRRAPRLATLIIDSVGESAIPEPPTAQSADAASIAQLSWQRFVRRAAAILAETSGSGAGWRRALLLRVFDALGSPHNRGPMRELAGWVCSWLEERDAPPQFNELAGRVFSLTPFSGSEVVRYGTPFVGEARARDVAELATASASSSGSVGWSRRGRPNNHPLLRLWGGCALLYRVLHRDWERRLLAAGSAGSWSELQRLVQVEGVGWSLIGAERARTIVVDAILPWALAAGLSRGDTALIRGALDLYRTAPTLGSNAVVRGFEGKYLGGRKLCGAFWQQGGIEWEQRHGSVDLRRPRHLREPRLRYHLSQLHLPAARFVAL